MITLARRGGWLLACALLAIFFQSFLRQPMAPWLVAGLGAFAVASAVAPFSALVVLAATGPLSTIIYTLGRAEAGHAVFAEGIVLGYLTGWTARRAFDGRPLEVPPGFRWPALLLALLAVASAIVHGWGLRAGAPDEPFFDLFDTYVLREYPLRPQGIAPVAAAIAFFEAMLLTLAAADACAGAYQRRLVVIRAMVVGAAATAFFNVNRLVQLAVAAERPWATFVDHFARTRVHVHYGDKNAAGSYFALTLMLAMGVTARHPVLALVTALPIAAGLWLAGSRVAAAAAFIAGAAVIILLVRRAASRAPRIAVALTVIALVSAAGAVYTMYPEGRNFAASRALEMRVGMARAGLQMAAEHPVFGVGLGRFYGLSGDYAGATLAKFRFAHENAHNNFVQILAELGVPGLMLFLWLVGYALASALRGTRPRPLHLTALAAGIFAFLVTCLGGHPLIVPEAAYPFWLAIGVAGAPMLAIPTASRGRRAAVVLAAVAIAGSVPWRAVQAAREADLEHVSSGFSMWQHEPGGWRHRWMGGRATFYVASDATAVRMQMRIGVVVRRPIEVTVFLDGREVNRLMLSADDQWRTLRFLVREPASGAAFTRVDLVAAEPGQPPFEATASSDSGIVMVRAPEIER